MALTSHVELDQSRAHDAGRLKALIAVAALGGPLTLLMSMAWTH